MYTTVFADALQMEVKDALPIIKSWGMEYVDIRERVNGKIIHQLSEAELKDLKKQIDDLGLKVGAIESYIGKCHMNNVDMDAEWEKLEGVIRASKILECNMVRSFFFWQPKVKDGGNADEKYGKLKDLPEERKKLVELYAPLAKRAKEAGLKIAFENCGATCYDVFAFLEELDIPEFGLCWDVEHDLDDFRPKDWAVFFKKCLSKTIMVHVKGASMHSEIPGTKVPWDRVLGGVAATRREMPISIETGSKVAPLDPVEVTKYIYDTLKTVWPYKVPESIDSAVAEPPEKEDTRVFPPCPYADNPVRLVVVGLGMGRYRVNQIMKTPGIKLMGVCDTNLERAKDVGENVGVPYSDDINVFLNDPEVEAMYVVTPTGLHCSVSEQCLLAGKHVLTTKPLDVSIENCRRVIKIAKEKGLLFGVDFDLHHTPELPDLMEAVKRGYFGRLLHVYCNIYINRPQAYFDENGGWRGTWELDGGGSMCNQGVHEIDRVVSAFGMPKRIRARMALETHRIETEDHGWSEWEYEDGFVVRYSSTTSYPLPTWYLSVEAHGTEGAYVHKTGGPEGSHTWWARAMGEWTTKAPYPNEYRWRQGSDHFAYCLRMGEPYPLDGDAGLKSVRVLDAIYKSAKTEDGDWINVED